MLAEKCVAGNEVWSIISRHQRLKREVELRLTDKASNKLLGHASDRNNAQDRTHRRGHGIWSSTLGAVCWESIIRMGKHLVTSDWTHLSSTREAVSANRTIPPGPLPWVFVSASLVVR